MTSKTPSADKIFTVGSGQVGYHEGANNYNKFAAAVGVPNNDAWCTTFASWEFLTAGFKSLALMSDYSIDQLNWFTARNRASAYPAVGALVWLGPGGGDHTAWVYAYDADNIYTIEGNWNDQVLYLKRPRRVAGPGGIEPYMYGLPNFAEGVLTADPAHPVAGSKYQAVASVTTSAKVPGIVSTPVVVPPVKPPVSTTPWVWADVGNTKAKEPASVSVVRAALNKEFKSTGTATTWDAATMALYVRWQKSLGYSGADADGIPGLTSLTALAVKYKFTLKGAFPNGTTVTPPQSSGSGLSPISAKSVTFNRYTGGGTSATWIKGACAAAGVPYNTYWQTGMVTAMNRESSGNANACNINDLNNVTPAGFSKVKDYGDGYYSNGTIAPINGALTNFQCSRGAWQTIPQTFASNHAAGTSVNIYDPVAVGAAAILYVIANYGVNKDGSNLASRVQQFDPNRSPRGY